MSSRNWLNLGLLVLVATLTLIVWLEPGRTPQPATPPLLDIAPEQVEHIEVLQPGESPIVLDKRDTGWTLTSPLRGPVNEQLMQQLLKIPRERCGRHYADDDVDLAQSGLEPPLLQLTMGNQVVAFGGTDPIDRNRYVRIGTKVHLCVDRFFYLLTGGPESFVSAADTTTEIP